MKVYIATERFLYVDESLPEILGVYSNIEMAINKIESRIENNDDWHHGDCVDSIVKYLFNKEEDYELWIEEWEVDTDE